ncbi:MAG: repair protein recO [Gemmatimonadetes bacterium]|jgi:DNA repair protein RecO (recombination protein O)|nr:repair protein recO [Gemmatimonadota bacterium]
MPLLATDAVVLHAFNYLESSRILRLVTREGGVRSALAKGARRSSRRFGSAVDLFAQGSAQLYTKPGRDLDTLGAFDVTASREGLAADMGRFSGASAIAELTLRFGRDAADSALYEAVVEALDALATAPSHATLTTTLAGAWRIVAELGFAPTIDACGDCHAPLDLDATVMFSHRAGGALCTRCGRLAPSGRVLPPAARSTLRELLGGRASAVLDDASVRAHQRLLREFLGEHLTDGRPLRALELWEEQRW